MKDMPTLLRTYCTSGSAQTSKEMTEEDSWAVMMTAAKLLWTFFCLGILNILMGTVVGHVRAKSPLRVSQWDNLATNLTLSSNN